MTSLTECSQGRANGFGRAISHMNHYDLRMDHLWKASQALDTKTHTGKLVDANTAGLVNLWITDIRDTRDKHVDVLRRLKGDAQVDKLVELNVMRQVRCASGVSTDNVGSCTLSKYQLH